MWKDDFSRHVKAKRLMSFESGFSRSYLQKDSSRLIRAHRERTVSTREWRRWRRDATLYTCIRGLYALGVRVYARALVLFLSLPLSLFYSASLPVSLSFSLFLNFTLYLPLSLFSSLFLTFALYLFICSSFFLSEFYYFFSFLNFIYYLSI